MNFSRTRAIGASLVLFLIAARVCAQPDSAAAVPDTPGTGPFPALKEEVASLPDHVVYRPADLSTLPAGKLGIVAWGNGGCSDDGASTRFHLLELASHGYLVIASGRIFSGPGASVRAPQPDPEPGQTLAARTRASDLTRAINWALAENQRAGSVYYGLIDPEQIALSGWSCGGIQALRVAHDPRVKTLVLHNTGIFNEDPPDLPEMDLRKDALRNVHTPVIYILGGPNDIAWENGMDDFERIDGVPVAVANLAVGHGGTFQETNGGAAAAVAVSWLNWQLRGDVPAAGEFVGNGCGLCRDSRWQLQRRNFHLLSGTSSATAALEQRLRSVEDYMQIEQLLMRYAAALNTNDAETYVSLFTPDAVFELRRDIDEPPFLGPFVGHDALRKQWFPDGGASGSLRGREFGPMRHVTTNYEIQLNGDRANVRAFFVEVVSNGMNSPPGSNPPTIHAMGRYEDELVRHNGTWLFSRRVVITDMNTKWEPGR
ncbi:MAG: nuclear transport factor 2 family protein [Gammaproteobacteria bacterium]|jgi:hypothetical protein